jgi:hypothetical protein
MTRLPDNFFGFDFEFCTISMSVMLKYKILVKKIFDWTIMGELRLFRVVLGLRGMKKNFKIGLKNFLFFKSYMTLKYLLVIDFPKFDPLTAAEMALC